MNHEKNNESISGHNIVDGNVFCLWMYEAR